MIKFRSNLDPLAVASALSKAIYDQDVPVPDGVPFLADPAITGGHPWYELSNANDHKLDVHGDGTFTYRDRYYNPLRVARVAHVLNSIGAEVL